jgi:hypothetical protein
MKLWLAALLVLVTALAAAAANPVVGTWQISSVTDDGQEYAWKLILKEDGGNLTGTLSGEPGDYPLSDVKFEKDILTFKVTVEDQTYSCEAKVSGNSLEGAFKGGAASGKLKGTKES